MKRFSAFTLAEVLITLGIIGVVAAMTMPALINNTRNKELQVQFKKTYTELNQASQKFKLDNEIAIPEYAKSYGTTKMISELKKYFKGAVSLTGGTNYEGEALGNYQMYTLGGTKVHHGICDVTGFFAESGGRVFRFNENPPAENENGPSVCIDINGAKKPNRYGIDIFIFLFTTDGFVIPMGQQHKNNPGYTGYFTDGQSDNCFVTGSEFCKVSNNLGQQAACAVYAMLDEHPSVKGKNYWHDFIGKGR